MASFSYSLDEGFALSTDRSSFLETLIPNSEDHRYYKALHLLHSGELEELVSWMRAWRAAHPGGIPPRWNEIMHRLELTWGADRPERLSRYLKHQLALVHDHARQVADSVMGHPDTLDESALQWDALCVEAGEGRAHPIEGMTNASLPRWVRDQVAVVDALWTERQDLAASMAAGTSSTGELERVEDALRESVRVGAPVLARVTQANLPGLMTWIAADLTYGHKQIFGGREVHAALTLAQIETLAELCPSILRQEPFVHAWIQRMRPAQHLDLQDNTEVRTAYLERLWVLVEGLDASFHELKAHVLYHRLALARHDLETDQGVSPSWLGLLSQYLQLPRLGERTHRDILARHQDRNHVQLGWDGRRVTGLETVDDDRELVEAYLDATFALDDGFERWQGVVADDFLRRRFVTAKLLDGFGASEDLARHWPAGSSESFERYAKSLEARVMLSFCRPRVMQFAADAPVQLAVQLKRVSRLIVKVYALQPLAYLLSEGRPLDAAIDLDGLLPTHERSIEIDAPPIRRVTQVLDVPEIVGPGCWLVELIGGGQSIRALVQRGRLRLLQDEVEDGHRLTVVDESGTCLEDAVVWMDGQPLTATDGVLVVPWGAKSQRRVVVLQHGDLAELASLQHGAEAYLFDAHIHIDREQLIEGMEATVLMRPSLTVSGVPCRRELVEDTVVRVHVTDSSATESSITLSDVDWSEDVARVAFRVPERVTAVRVEVAGRIQRQRDMAWVDVVSSRSYSVNQVGGEEHTAHLYLRYDEQGYHVWLLGKNGEPRSHQVIQVELHHDLVKRPLRQVLQTDAQGAIHLGMLDDVSRVTAHGPADLTMSWSLQRARISQKRVRHARAGEAICVASAVGFTADSTSLVRWSHGVPVEDCDEALTHDSGMVRVEGLDEGRYRLTCWRTSQQVLLDVSAGVMQGDWIVSDTSILKHDNVAPLQIAEVSRDDGLTISLLHATPTTRVHVVGTAFAPEHAMFDELGSSARDVPRRMSWSARGVTYLEGQTLGDEQRYILHRRHAKKYAGNLLTRPGLLLQPLSRRDTRTQDVVAGARPGAPAAARMGAAGGAYADDAFAAPAAKPDMGSGGLDFLGSGSVWMINLVPDAVGVVRVPPGVLRAHDAVQVLAIDSTSSAYRWVPGMATEVPCRERRMMTPLPADVPYALHNQALGHPAGAPLETAVGGASSLQLYDSLDKAMTLLTTLSGDKTLATYAFVVRWPHLDQAEQHRLYSEHACHELNFFLYRKDRAFFDRVVLPYLANKLHKTFMDRYLLGDDLSDYLTPAAYARCHVVERLLLAERCPEAAEGIRRAVEDAYALLPSKLEHEEALFQAALRGGQLDVVTSGVPGGMFDVAEEEAPPPPPPPRRRAKNKKRRARSSAPPKLFREPEATQELAETNYRGQRLGQERDALVSIHAFWRDYARRDPSKPFLSPNFVAASSHFTEIMLALAVLDLPWTSTPATVRSRETGAEVTASGDCISFRSCLTPAKPPQGRGGVLINQVYVRQDDAYRIEKGEKVEKTVDGELLQHVVYICQVVLTNPTSATCEIDLLCQIPEGSIAVSGEQATRGLSLRLEPFSTHAHRYGFYFPRAGRFAHYPAHVSQRGHLVAAAEARVLDVLERLPVRDDSAWPHLSQHGSSEQVLAYLESANLFDTPLEPIAWRMRDRAFYDDVISLLTRRRCFSRVVWSYAAYHDVVADMLEFVRHEDELLAKLGGGLWTPHLTIDPAERGDYEHLDYAPLIHDRAHSLRERSVIANQQLKVQYERFVQGLRYRPSLSADELLMAAYYLILLGRYDEGLQTLERVVPEEISSRLQYDYLSAYVAFLREDVEAARGIAERYRNYPVVRWRRLFAEVLSQLAELEGADPTVVDPTSATQQQTHQAAARPSLEMRVEGTTTILTTTKIEAVQVSYYVMDIELLFSRQPFVQQGVGQFRWVQPTRREVLALERDGEIRLALPDALRGRNVMIEVEGGGQRRSGTCFNHALGLAISEPDGLVRVWARETRAPLPRTYVKVFAKRRDGSVRFHKDGYTDLRGCFDVASTTVGSLDGVVKLAVLIMHDTHGAVTRELMPPRR